MAEGNECSIIASASFIASPGGTSSSSADDGMVEARRPIYRADMRRRQDIARRWQRKYEATAAVGPRLHVVPGRELASEAVADARE